MLALNSIRKGFSRGAAPVLDGLELSVAGGELFVLLGPSGSGKTTLLRLIAGLEAPDAGEIQLADRLLSAPARGVHVAPSRRGVGMLFQDEALFPHLDVRGNVGFGLGRWTREERESRVDELLRLTRLEGLEARRPDELSGGERQRVSLARSLAPRPRLLLLDEPFEHLEPRLREQVGQETRTLLHEEGVTAILVTHGPGEARRLADRLGLLIDGKIARTGEPGPLLEEVGGEISDRWLAGRS